MKQNDYGRAKEQREREKAERRAAKQREKSAVTNVSTDAPRRKGDR